MPFLITCSIKSPRKYFDSRVVHRRGELRLVEFPEADATLRDGVHGRWIKVHESPEVVMPGHHKVNGGCFHEEKFYFVTFGQVFKADLFRETCRPVWTAPFLHDLHGVGIFNGCMYVVNTGLERIEVLSLPRFDDHRTIDLQQHIGTCRRFDLSLDYRHVWTTQPHLVHANHCFWLDGEVWVTRFCQGDALALDSGRRIDLSPWGNPHDGCVHGDKVFFTTAQGHLVCYDAALRPLDSWDLNGLMNRGQLGWCRGVAVEGETALVAFTQFRPSVTREMGNWILRGRNATRHPSCIIKLDMRRQKVLAVYDFAEKDLTIYGIYHAP